MTEEQVGIWVSKLIAEDRIKDFYNSMHWRILRREVLEGHKNECQHCKKKGYYTKANHVHHVQYVRNHPRLALSKEYEFKGKRYKNLIPLCKACHEEVHDRIIVNSKSLLTEERW